MHIVILEIIGLLVVLALMGFGVYFYIKRFTTFNEDIKKFNKDEDK